MARLTLHHTKLKQNNRQLILKKTSIKITAPMIQKLLPLTKWRSVHLAISWWLSSQCQRSKSIHDKINPEKLHNKQQMLSHQHEAHMSMRTRTHTHTNNLHSIQWDIPRGNCCHNIYNQSCDIDCKVELNEFLNICIYRSTPSDNLHYKHQQQQSHSPKILGSK